jgi:HlyD family secretion protein
MDRPLDDDTLRRRLKRRVFRIGLAAGGVLALLFLLSSLLRPSLGRDEIRTAFVRRGSIEGTISATGAVVPNFEQVIASPAETRLLAVRKKPGDAVKKGESVLSLDPSELNLALERIGRELTLKENGKARLRLDIERTLDELDGQLNIKNLRLEYLRSKSAQGDKMIAIGAISKDQLDQTKLEERIAGIEKEDLEKSIRSTKLSLENQLEGITAEVRTMLKEKEDIQRQLKLLSCEADRQGVVTWVRDEIGSSIHRGDLVVRIADLGSYRVEAALSDVHASALTRGMPAVVRLNDSTLAGELETVYPNVENGVVRITVSLKNPANSALRPNLRVGVSLVTSRRDGALLLKKGAFLTGGNRQELFVIAGGTARRTVVTSGVVGFDEVEILDGLAEGDEAIISDMGDYSNTTEVTIH